MIDISIKDKTAHVILNRPEKHNALDPDMIEQLQTQFQSLGVNPKVRQIVVSSKGKTFCAGADLNWMKESIKMSKQQNLDSALKLFDMFATIYACPKPVIGRVHGSAFGGGVGMIACFDMAIMHQDAVLSLSELKLGLIPSTIAPFLSRKVGFRHLKYYGLTSERISAQKGHDIGLIHDVAQDTQTLDQKINKLISGLETLSPQAIARYKKMCEDIRPLSIDEARMMTSEEIADIRTTDQAQEGLNAFFEKRLPRW